MVMSALLGLPALLWTGLPNAAALPWIVGSTSINLVIVTALLRAYGLIGFGTAYPVVRALSVMLVTPLGDPAVGRAAEPLGPASASA